MVENEQGINVFEAPNYMAVKFINCDGKTDESTNTLVGGVTFRFAPYMFVAIGRDIQGASDGPTISAGTNAPDYDNVVAATDLGTGLVATDDCYAKILAKNAVMPPIGTDIVLRIRSIASGGSLYRFDVMVIGPMSSA